MAIDLIIIGVILLSGVFAMMRGLTRELFSIFSWLFAGAITYFLYPPLEGLGVSTLSFLPELIAQVATGVLIFAFILLSISFVTMKLTEKLRGKEPGKVDGTAGFLFGLIRGYILICLLFLMLSAFWVPSEEPEWLAKSSLRPTIDKTNKQILSLISKTEDQLPEPIKPTPSSDDALGRLIEQNNR